MGKGREKEKERWDKGKENIEKGRRGKEEKRWLEGSMGRDGMKEMKNKTEKDQEG